MRQGRYLKLTGANTEETLQFFLNAVSNDDTLAADFTLNDSHAHCQHKALYSMTDEIISQAQRCRIGTIVNNAAGYDWDDIIALSRKSPIFKTALAIHPWNIDENWKERMRLLASLLKEPSVVAIGECGLDKSKLYSPMNLQIEVFEAHLRVAKENNLPVIAHNVKAHQEIFHSIRRLGMDSHPVVLHGFQGNGELIDFFSRFNIYYSINPRIVQRKTKSLSFTLRKLIDSGRMLFESDSPFMSPYDRNSQSNVPANIVYTICAISDFCEFTPGRIIKSAANLFAADL